MHPSGVLPVGQARSVPPDLLDFRRAWANAGQSHRIRTTGPPHDPVAANPVRPAAVAERETGHLIRFSILGPVEVRDRQHSLTPNARKVRTLLAALLVRRDAVVSVETLTDELWGHEPPPTALRALRVYVSQLRKVLASAEPGSMIVTQAPGYRIELAAGSLDVLDFEEHCQQARRAVDGGHLEFAAREYGRALELWRGPALADVRSGPVVSGAALRLDEARMAALERRVDIDLALGRHRDLIGELRGLVTDHPLNESINARLMVALHRSGRTREALEVYRGVRRHLMEELGCEPGEELREAQRSVLGGAGGWGPEPARALVTPARW
jgi:SARP family transcriptional regulator, regulator of embCAB operon